MLPDVSMMNSTLGRAPAPVVNVELRKTSESSASDGCEPSIAVRPASVQRMRLTGDFMFLSSNYCACFGTWTTRRDKLDVSLSCMTTRLASACWSR